MVRQHLHLKLLSCSVFVLWSILITVTGYQSIYAVAGTHLTDIQNSRQVPGVLSDTFSQICFAVTEPQGLNVEGQPHIYMFSPPPPLLKSIIIVSCIKKCIKYKQFIITFRCVSIGYLVAKNKPPRILPQFQLFPQTIVHQILQGLQT